MATRIDSTAVVLGNRVHHSARKLSDRAVEEAIASAGIEKREVDLLLNAGLYHDRILGEPAMAAIIQQDVDVHPEDPHGEGHGTFSFDVANGSAGVLSALQVADGFLRAGTAQRVAIVAGDADPGHHLAPGFPYDPAGAALVCGWDSTDRGLVGFRWLTTAGAAGARESVVRFEHGHNQLLIREDEAFSEVAAACAGRVATELLAELGVPPGEVTAVAAAPFDTTFVDALSPHLAVDADRFVRPRSAARIHTAGLIAAIDGATSRPPSAADGERVLLVAAGAGPTAGAALLVR